MIGRTAAIIAIVLHRYHPDLSLCPHQLAGRSRTALQREQRALRRFVPAIPAMADTWIEMVMGSAANDPNGLLCGRRWSSLSTWQDCMQCRSRPFSDTQRPIFAP